VRTLRPVSLLATAIAVLVLAGCATTIPEAIRETPPGNPTPVEVRASPDRFVGQRVRWGGTIASVDNREDATLIEVVARQLGDNGRPEDGDVSFGRFIAKVNGFADPAIYSEGRDLTVVGTLGEPVRKSIGKYPYLYPVVQVSSHYLWPSKPPPAYYYDPYWYDPWYDPWYPFSPWPYYRRPYYW
jgi:outer membrane lipoprotein